MVNDRVEICELNGDLLLFEKLLEVLPIVNFLIKFKAVVELVHLDVLWVIPTPMS